MNTVRSDSVTANEVYFNVSCMTRTVTCEVWNAVKSYLIKIWAHDVRTEKFELTEVMSYSDVIGIVSDPVIAGLDLFDNVVSRDSAFFAIVQYKGNKYYISLIRLVKFRDRKEYIINISGSNPLQCNPEALCNLLVTEGIRNSGYSGKVLKVTFDRIEQQGIVHQLPEPDITLNDIYCTSKSDLYDFVEVVTKRKPGASGTSLWASPVQEKQTQSRQLYGSATMPTPH